MWGDVALNATARRLLEALRKDFAETTGQPFSHFFCPVLFRDEDAPLCRAHIVNTAFTGSSRRWTLQRRDVDNFYGSMFESPFVDLQTGGHGINAEVFADPLLYKRLRPRILVDGAEVKHYIAESSVPEHFTQVLLESSAGTVRLVLMMPPSEHSRRLHSKWQVVVSKDVRLPAVVSVLKAADLTLFEMLGYRYALGRAGRYLGELLGGFFTQNVGRPGREIIRSALSVFEPRAKLVRPLLPGSSRLKGSVDDRLFNVCWGEGSANPWGIIVYVRTGEMLHAALVPMFQDPIGAEKFEQFMTSSQTMLVTGLAKLEDDHWAVSSRRTAVEWPPGDLS